MTERRSIRMKLCHCLLHWKPIDYKKKLTVLSWETLTRVSLCLTRAHTGPSIAFNASPQDATQCYDSNMNTLGYTVTEKPT